MNPGELTLEPFRGDYEALEKMAHSSWRDEYGMSSFPNFYRPAFLRYLFGRIQHEDHLIAAYRGDEIVSFMGNAPHSFHFRGQVYRGPWSCLLVTRKELLRQGHALAIIREALRLNRTYRYDFALATFETGHRSTLMLQKLREEGNRLEYMKRLRVIARITDLGRVEASEGLKSWEKAAVKLIGGDRKPRWGGDEAVREYRPDDLDDCLSLFNGYRDTIELARVWEREELAWELACPDVAQTVVYEEDGRIKGALNFIFHDHLGRTKERWAWINHVAYPGLNPRERFLFIQAFLRYIRARDCIGAIEWTKDYYPLGPLYRARFFPYFRSVNMYSWTFNPEISLEKVRACNEILV
ncbi:MAG: hypothetical protein JXE07_02955 [Candidatus Aminicenantes bacterium]|nr:hypothetical protein [Candidatus Aminicenantes bacterium]